jgi:alanine-synthesizing transaminase
MDSVRFAVEMMEWTNVAVTPGAGVGNEGDGYLRLALVENENCIRRGLKLMHRGLTALANDPPSTGG